MTEQNLPSEEGNENEDQEQEETQENNNQLTLEEYNEKVGRNYKTWEDVAKGEKERNKLFAEQGQQKDEPTEANNEDSTPTKKEVTPPDVKEELLLIRHPEAEHVLDEIKENLKDGEDVLQVYRNSTYFQKEAQARAEDTKIRQEAGNKISDPASKIPLKTKVENAKSWNDLSPEDRVKVFRERAKQEQNAMETGGL